MGNVWEWGAEVGGHYWRTSGDLTDVWSNMSSVGFRQAGREKWSRPGHWTDPDMLVVGKVGWGPNIHDTRLTPHEQITHISLWALQAAPLLIGADMTQFDPFTTALMTNHEVLEMNQDVLGKGAARSISASGSSCGRVRWPTAPSRPGCSIAGLQPVKMSASWKELGLSGAQPVRDLWLHKDLGTVNGEFSAVVPAHGAVLVKIGRPRRQ